MVETYRGCVNGFIQRKNKGYAGWFIYMTISKNNGIGAVSKMIKSILLLHKLEFLQVLCPYHYNQFIRSTNDRPTQAQEGNVNAALWQPRRQKGDCGQQNSAVVFTLKKCQYLLYRKLGGPLRLSGWLEKMSSSPRCDPRPYSGSQVAIPTELTRQPLSLKCKYSMFVDKHMGLFS